MNVKHIVYFANEEERFEGVAFVNEVAIQEDGWAMIAPYGDYPGKAMLRKPDGTIEKFDAIQRLDRQAAEQMVHNFKSIWQRAKRFFRGLPIYVGHPDVPSFANEYPDKTEKGMFVDLEAREDGLYGKPVFTNEGSDLLEQRKYRAFSGYWSADFLNEEGGKKIYRPDVLKSAGLTNRPNLPVHLMNEKETEPANATIMDKQKLLARLKQNGIELPADATDEQIETALDTLGQRSVTVANEKQTIETTLATAQGTITTLTGKLDTLQTDFANERKGRIELLIGNAIGQGRITEAQRAEWTGKLETDFANESENLAKLPKAIKTESITGNLGVRKVEMANVQERAEKAQQLVSAHMKAHNVDYNTAFAAVEKANPELFGQMQRPAGK